MDAQYSTVLVRPAAGSYEEGLAYARFVNMASEGGFRKALGRRWADIIATAFVEPDHDLSWIHTVFAERDGELVGMTAGYTAEQHTGAAGKALKLAKGNRLRRVMGLALLNMVMQVLGEMEVESYYLQFLAVEKALRVKPARNKGHTDQ